MKKRQNSLDLKRKDAKELIGILKEIPEERRKEILGIVRGYALCAEYENQNVS